MGDEEPVEKTKTGKLAAGRCRNCKDPYSEEELAKGECDNCGTPIVLDDQ